MKRSKTQKATIEEQFRFSAIALYLRANGWGKEADDFTTNYAPRLIAEGVHEPMRFGCPTGYASNVCVLNMIYPNGVWLGISFPCDGYVAGCSVHRAVRGKYGNSRENEKCSQLSPELAAKLLAIFIADAAIPDSKRKERAE